MHTWIQMIPGVIWLTYECNMSHRSKPGSEPHHFGSSSWALHLLYYSPTVCFGPFVSPSPFLIRPPSVWSVSVLGYCCVFWWVFSFRCCLFIISTCPWVYLPPCVTGFLSPLITAMYLVCVSSNHVHVGLPILFILPCDPFLHHVLCE